MEGLWRGVGGCRGVQRGVDKGCRAADLDVGREHMSEAMLYPKRVEEVEPAGEDVHPPPLSSKQLPDGTCGTGGARRTHGTSGSALSTGP